MSLFTKILIGSWLLASIILWYSFTFWESQDFTQERKIEQLVNYKEAESIAQRYIDMNRDDDLWKNNSPRLWESTPLYMEKTTPSYMEYSVVCDRNPDCWYIIVNIDGDDVQVPIASPSDYAPSQILIDKSWEKKENLQFFYFWPFDIYSKNLLTENIHAINPSIDPIEKKEIFDTMDEKERILTVQIWEDKRKQLQNILDEKLSKVTKYKQSEDFKKYKDQKNSLYVPMATPNWKYVYGNTTDDCDSHVPCYEQYAYWYNWSYCDTWCAPVAAAIIFWYHDIHNYPNLLEDKIAPMTNDQYYFIESNPTPKSMINEIRTHMSTECNNFAWSTQPENIPSGIQYAREHGYPFSQPIVHDASWNMTPAYPLEINANNPFILVLLENGTSNWHAVVVYGYDKNNAFQVRVNAWWGKGATSHASVNIWSMSLKAKNYNTLSMIYYHIQ